MSRGNAREPGERGHQAGGATAAAPPRRHAQGSRSSPRPAAAPRDLRSVVWPAGTSVLVLAPHPDDFDCIAVTMAVLRDAGVTIDLAVLTGAASGVDDSFCSPPTAERKAAVREAEQRASCELFGLPQERLHFVGWKEDRDGHPFEEAGNLAALRRLWESTSPDLVFLPHPNDTNAGHRRTYRMSRRVAAGTAALLNEDPKSIAMRYDAYCGFGEEEAGWKAELLRCHRSQQQRNLETRGFGLDERILAVNRAAAERLGLAEPYTETFEAEAWGESAPDLLHREQRGTE